MPLDQGFVKTFHDNVAIDVGSGWFYTLRCRCLFFLTTYKNGALVSGWVTFRSTARHKGTIYYIVQKVPWEKILFLCVTYTGNVLDRHR
jgi:hypothetical protein